MENRILKSKIVLHFGSSFRFAHHLGIHESAVSKIIHGWKCLEEKEKMRWAQHLKSTVEELFGGEEQ